MRERDAVLDAEDRIAAASFLQLLEERLGVLVQDQRERVHRHCEIASQT